MTATEQGMDLEGAGLGAPQRFANPLAIAWRRKGVLVLGLVAGAVAGVLYYSQSTPVYQSSAQVLVVKKQSTAIPMAPGTSGMTGVPQMYVEDYLTTHTILIRSQLLLRRAGALLELEHPGVIPSGQDPAAFIGSGLTVTREVRDGNVAASNVLNVSFRGREPQNCPKVVNAIVKAYQDFLNETYVGLNREFARDFTKLKDEAVKQIAEKEEVYNKIAKENPAAVLRKDVLLAVEPSRLAATQNQLRELERKQLEIKSAKKVILERLKAGQDRGTVLKLAEKRQSETRVTGAGEQPKTPEDQLAQMEFQLAELLQDFGKDHPQVVSLRRRIDAFKQRLGAARTQSADKTNDKDGLDLFLLSLDDQYQTNEMLLKDITGAFASEQQEWSTTAIYLQKLADAKKEVDRLLPQRDLLIARLNTMNATAESDIYKAQTIVDAGPGNKVAPSLMQTLALAGIAGGLFGMGLAYLAEWTDKGFKSPEEIRQRLGLSVVGHIPPLEESQEVLDPRIDARLVAFHAPNSREAEAFRGLRTSLYFSTQGRGHQVIQMTSPTKGDGKSTLLANLAISIAQSGKRVILLDADFRRPNVHKLFRLGGDEKGGLASVLTGEVELPDALRPCEAIPNLSILPCGPRPENPAEVLTSPRFQELLGVLRERCDFVLVDTPPLLAVSDPASVAPFVDGVLMTLRLSKTVRPQAERANEVLASLGANVLGVVVNGAGGYGQQYSYGYNYGYSYGYNYGYNYSYEAYEEQPNGEPKPPRAGKTGSHPSGA